MSEIYYGVGRSGRALTIEIENIENAAYLDIDSGLNSSLTRMYIWEGRVLATRWFASGHALRRYLRAVHSLGYDFDVDRWGQGYGDRDGGPPEPDGYNWENERGLRERR